MRLRRRRRPPITRAHQRILCVLLADPDVPRGAYDLYLLTGVRPGRLYRTLDHLRTMGYVLRGDPQPNPRDPDAPPRVFYSLTPGALLGARAAIHDPEHR